MLAGTAGRDAPIAEAPPLPRGAAPRAGETLAQPPLPPRWGAGPWLCKAESSGKKHPPYPPLHGISPPAGGAIFPVRTSSAVSPTRNLRVGRQGTACVDFPLGQPWDREFLAGGCVVPALQLLLPLVDATSEQLSAGPFELEVPGPRATPVGPALGGRFGDLSLWGELCPLRFWTPEREVPPPTKLRNSLQARVSLSQLARSAIRRGGNFTRVPSLTTFASSGWAGPGQTLKTVACASSDRASKPPL